ncbi:ABC transporter ATP-binding protein YtrB [Rubripirellula lacrimiformis]|uniref:ABC transporter ATP-binding protein YtrB n=1 Tax=Rubripirellula lacrimiformis TaxID=1930273 RepID=A0A517NGQ5_9BACT|nr:ABC transporter ATP-binding protein [Rubripirellula lacrimiformis]QDT06315.1 ABC transporter ATP-binding protein YtrB [Rubripirellula lacrimiformis]
MNAAVIELDRLTRYFGKRAVVRDLDLQIPAGQVTALLGLNGAGKTTTIRIIMGLLYPTRGKATVLGHDTGQLSPEIRMRIGYMIEGHFLYPGLRVRECADLQRSGYPHWDDGLFQQVVHHFGVGLNDRAGELSRGQRAGVSLALVLAPDPELLVLDDPSLGLDPVSRRALNETLIEFAADGKRTVLLSSHMLDDVERVADRVAVMTAGRLQVDTTMDDFSKRVSGWVVEIAEVDLKLIESIPRLIEARQIGARLQLVVADADDETTAAIDRLGATGVEPIEMTFGDSVLAYLARRRGESSFLGADASVSTQSGVKR